MKGLLLLVLIGSACAISSDGGAAEATTRASTVFTAPLSTTTSTLKAATTTTSANLPPVLAIHTQTGVPVAVLSAAGSGYIVRTTCGQTAYVASGTPIIQPIVVLDPGHGGPSDTGAVGHGGLMEKDVNLAVARAAQIEMEARGISLVLTRTGDYGVPLANRAVFADHIGAQLMISIHHNAPTPRASEGPGTEIFVQSESSDSARLGGLVWEHLTQALSPFDIRWAASPDAGVLTVLNTRGTDAYGMLRRPSTVTVLAELLYISSHHEASLMIAQEYLDVAATALADAVDAYLDTEAPGAGYVAEPRVFNPQPGISTDLCEEAQLE